MAALNDNLDFLDPNWPGTWPPVPPIPPRRAPGSGRKTQIVWPRDKKQKGAHTWSRWRDIFTCKGPDMWVGKQGDIGPTRPEWSGWDMGAKGGPFNNLGYWDSREKQIPPWLYAHRNEQKIYNFKNRKYEEPHANTWSDVKWDRTGRRPLYVRDRNGHFNIHPALEPQLWDQGLYHWDGNPFVHNPKTNWWNNYIDQLPRDFPAVDLDRDVVQLWR
ncbi:MAG: hypothetical protein LQ338_000746 [Usnochroma carphineum]|nr:MAG: hypothetical protein LQ338_000746 [Usnochroma carphineum]